MGQTAMYVFLRLKQLINIYWSARCERDKHSDDNKIGKRLDLLVSLSHHRQNSIKAD